MLTVIFATRNGLRTLPAVLDAYLRLQVPDGARYLFREMLLRTALFSKCLLMFRGEAIFRARWDLNVLRGQIIEAYLSRGEQPGGAM